MKHIALGMVILAAAAPAAAQTPLPVQIEALVPRTDSIIIRMNGNPIGWQRYRTEKTAAGFLLTEETVTPRGGQKTRVELDHAGAVRSVRQEGLGAAAPVFTDIVFSEGRVKGKHATMSAPGKADTTSLDMSIPAGAIDDNTLQHLMPALAWTEKAAWTFPFFSSGRRASSTRTLKVTGVESVTVPAGTFDTYRADMDAGDNTLTFNITRDRPHRVVQIRISAMPMDFVLAK